MLLIARPKTRQIRGGILQKGAPGWVKMLWVGRNEESGEHIGLTAEGVQEGRAVRRLMESDRANMELFGRVPGVPWNTLARRPRMEPIGPPPAPTLAPLASPDELAAAASSSAAATAAAQQSAFSTPPAAPTAGTLPTQNQQGTTPARPATSGAALAASVTPSSTQAS